MPKTIAVFLLGLVFLGVGFFSFSIPVKAGDFNQVSLRLDRTKVSVSDGGLVCVNPETVGSESSVEVTFPQGFTVNGSASNWTVNTNDLPAGAVAWPGIGTASSVAGQTVTFPSSDLSVNTLYCFNFSGTNTITNPASIGNYSGVITTKSLSVIDSAGFALSITNSDQIAITAQVGQSPANFPVTLTTLTSGGPFPQDTEIQYQINYGSTSLTSTPMTLYANWTQGTLSGSGGQSVDIVDYVVGSASTGYGATPAVVDPVNRQISWTFPAFPGNTTNQIVTFSLKTNSSYTGTSTVNFEVNSHIETNTLATPYSTLSQSYKYVTASPAPAASPSPTASPIASPSPIPTVPLRINEVSMKFITATQSAIVVGANNPVTITINYGTSIKGLTKKIIAPTLASKQEIVLDDLTPQTPYYFTVTVQDGLGRRVTSDIFTFTTAAVSLVPKIHVDTLTVTSGSTILLSALTQGSQTVVITKNTIFNFKFLVDPYQDITGVQSFVRPDNVLGLNNVTEDDASSDRTKLIEIGNGNYFGKLKAPANLGFFGVFARISDTKGNLSEQQVLQLKVIDGLQIVNSKGVGIENARVLVSYFNPRNKLYEVIPAESFQIKNPSFSEPSGAVALVLPQGKYRVQVAALGYKEKTMDFTLGVEKGEQFPIVVLEKEPFNIISMLKYYNSTVSDFLHSSFHFLDTLATSNRFFDLVSTVVLGLSAIISLISLTLRTRIPLYKIPLYLILEIKELFHHSRVSSVISGVVEEEETKKPIQDALIYLIDRERSTTVAQTRSDAAGKFSFNTFVSHDYNLLIIKNGYAPSEHYGRAEDALHTIAIHKSDDYQEIFFTRIRSLLENFLSFFLEMTITISFIFEILFAYTFGPFKVFPFFILTVLTLITFLLFIKNSRRMPWVEKV